MTRLRLLAILFTLLAPPALAQDCACRTIPVAGTYDLPGTGRQLRMDFVGGDSTTCPTQLRVEVFPPIQQRAAFNAATLDCVKDGTFRGLDDMAFLQGEHGEWLIEAAPDVLPVDDEVAPGLSPATSFELTLIPPGSVKVLPGANSGDRHLTATLASHGGAAPCICGRVEKQLKAHDALLALFSDEALIEKAVTDGNYAVSAGMACMGSKLRRASDGSYTAEGVINTGSPSWGCEKREPADQGFYDLVSSRLRSGLKVAEDSKAGEAAGGTDPETCEFKPIEPLACDTQVFTNAVIAHERVHQRQCKEMNASTDLQKHAAATRDAIRGKPGHPDGVSLDYMTPSYLFFNNPRNTAMLEVEAYRVSRAILQGFADAYCP